MSTIFEAIENEHFRKPEPAEQLRAEFVSWLAEAPVNPMLKKPDRRETQFLEMILGGKKPAGENQLPRIEFDCPAVQKIGLDRYGKQTGPKDGLKEIEVKRDIPAVKKVGYTDEPWVCPPVLK